MMNPSRRSAARWIFPSAAVLSGFASGSGGLFFPGIFFGIAIAWAVHQTVEALHPAFAIVLILFAAFGFWAACITVLLSFRLTGSHNDFVGTTMIAVFAGGVWASLTAFGLAIASEHFPLMRVVPIMAVAGAVCGGGIFPVTIYFHDLGYLPHPFDFMLEFMVWQVSVASVAPLALKVSYRS